MSMHEAISKDPIRLNPYYDGWTDEQVLEESHNICGTSGTFARAEVASRLMKETLDRLNHRTVDEKTL